MTIADRIAQAHQRSVALYLQRQQVEMQRQQLQQQAARIDQELLMLDGQIALLTTMQDDAQ